MSKQIVCSIAIAFIMIAAMATWFIWLEPTIPPMSGTVHNKLVHPEYYPGGPNVYCIGIISIDHKNTCSWYVPERVYVRYQVGDSIGIPTGP